MPPPTAKQKKFTSSLCERTVQWTPTNSKRTALVRLRSKLDEFPHQSLPKPEIGVMSGRNLIDLRHEINMQIILQRHLRTMDTLTSCREG